MLSVTGPWMHVAKQRLALQASYRNKLQSTTRLLACPKDNREHTPCGSLEMFLVTFKTEKRGIGR